MPDSFNRAIIVGDACVDITIHLKDFLNNDSTRQMPYYTNCGGTSANTAVTLAKLGVNTSFLGCVGDDYGGKYILNEFKKINIDTSLTLVNKKLNTVDVFCLIDDNGERHLWGYPRQDVAYANLDINNIDIDKIKTASWFHSSGMTLLNNGNIKEVLPYLYKIAYESGVPTSFDFNTRVSNKNLLDEKSIEAIEKILPYVTYLTGSAKDEFMCFHPAKDYKESARYFSSNHKCVIARLASKGSYTISGGKEKLVEPFKVNVLNATGAGDNFNAGFIAAKLDGLDDFEATKYANATAAYKVSHESINDFNSEVLKQFISSYK